MPPKRKTRAAAASTKKRRTSKSEESIDNTKVESQLEEQSQQQTESSPPSPPQQQEHPAKALEETEIIADSSAESAPVTENVQKEQSSGMSLADRMQKLKELKRRRATEVAQGNSRDRNLEFQRSKENPRLEARNERKRLQALELQEKQKARDSGEDYERKQYWKYSAESVEAWEEKMQRKAEMANNGFTDHAQAAHKKYLKLISELKPDMAQYHEKKLEAIERAIRNGEDPSDIGAVANNLDYGALDDKPSKEAVDRLVQDTKKQIIRRETRSRERKEVADDISWINEKNRVFNQKIARFYDKYTKEIRENLERGTAL
ncbi:SYF2 splicing factor-domain-containing protein [Zychaea mexicana]|uniref:SYF2 splicing factor-domain-containing protein n=1 Tax=Zychaea mexicana TaxID=64656 RepID=UPI0022FDCD97|nr:SYF2 splicing factor-domain-containing protein [Zychaea mexicana]KAI9485053.1 SYF2 splicing factor-domain-containing protein [Zychaea mexicana]